MIIWDENGNRKETNSDFIDLGLPSGTLWAYRDIYKTEYESKFKDYFSGFHFINLTPTKDQFRELCKFCKIKQYRNFYLFVSKINNNKLILFDGYYKTVLYTINMSEVIFPDSSKFYHRHFWCLRLVKKK